MNMSNYSYNTLLYRRRDNSSPCTSNWINGVESDRPNIRFSWVDPSSPPITNFSSNTTSTCSGTVSFFDQSTNSPNSWLWNFGDGNSSTLQNPTHNYTSSGTFTVELITSNSFGSDTITFNNLIQVNLVNIPLLLPHAHQLLELQDYLEIMVSLSLILVIYLWFLVLLLKVIQISHVIHHYLYGQSYSLRAIHSSPIPQNFLDGLIITTMEFLNL